MKFIFAANRSLPLLSVASHLVRELAQLPMSATVLLRRPREGNPAAFEVLAAELCATLGISVEWKAPEEEHGTGRSATYSRDVDMARAADAGIFYFAPDALPENTGTGHLMERCIEEEKPIKAFTVDDGELTFIGSSTVD